MASTSSISQIVSASYPAVLAEMRSPANQWVESSFFKELERQGAVTRVSLGPTIETPISYRRNAGGKFLASDVEATSTTKTDVFTSASYAVAELSVPITWTKGDDMRNPSKNQKYAFVKNLLTNAIDTHDDLIEEALFAASTMGFLGMQTFMPTGGQGSAGGINAATDVFWRNANENYNANGSDIEAKFTEVYNTAAKGSGAMLAPKLMVSGGDTHALFESQLQAQQRYVDSQEAKSGFKTVAFKMARYVFSQHGDGNVYFLNPKSLQLMVSKEYFRDKGETQEITGQNAFECKSTRVFSW